MSGLLDRLLGKKTEEVEIEEVSSKSNSIKIKDGYTQEIFLLRYTSEEDNELVTFVINMTVDEWDKLDEDYKTKYVSNITLATIHNSTGMPGFGRYVGIDSTISDRRVKEQDE